MMFTLQRYLFSFSFCPEQTQIPNPKFIQTIVSLLFSAGRLSGGMRSHLGLSKQHFWRKARIGDLCQMAVKDVLALVQVVSHLIRGQRFSVAGRKKFSRFFSLNSPPTNPSPPQKKTKQGRIHGRVVRVGRDRDVGDQSDTG